MPYSHFKQMSSTISKTKGPSKFAGAFGFFQEILASVCQQAGSRE